MGGWLCHEMKAKIGDELAQHYNEINENGFSFYQCLQ